MPTISISGYIVTSPAPDWRIGMASVVNGMHYEFQTYKPRDDSGEAIVCEHMLEFEVPKGFDPRPQQIEALKAKEKKLRDEFATSVARIQRAISELSAIEYEAA